MNFYIVIPAHNEADHIGSTIQSLIDQSHRPKRLVVVDDNSTDDTAQIVKSYCKQHSWIDLVSIKSSDVHLPGTKIIKAFNKGFETLDSNFDVICKFDADLIFPENYIKKLASHFNQNPKLGMASGFCYIKLKDNWELENLTRKDHIRGALKAYRKLCFTQIGQLKESMGWDTVDELLAKYHGWEILTDKTLHVKHLKPTASTYHNTSKYLQGEAMYRMRYGFIITLITAVKLAWRRKRFRLLWDYLLGFYNAWINKSSFLVTEDQGKFIRKIRWRGIRGKFI
ncbi:MAG: glycosyltransferase family 2 protein [Winogradskyella sp.]|nr:glycosyltransferase family 2 protein [Winogradskyella sp.]